MTVRRYTHRPVTTQAGRPTWTVCDPLGLPVPEVDDYVLALSARKRSVNTQKAYCQHLAALLTFLGARGLVWDEAEFSDLSDFMVTFQTGVFPLERTRGTGPRDVDTVRAAAAAIKGFYEYQKYEHGVVPENLSLTIEVRRRAQHKAEHFLKHIEAAGDTYEANRLSHGLPNDEQPVELINFETDFSAMLDACRSARDRCLLSGLYDLGLRVGGLIGLQHGDLNVPREEVTVERREDNPNGALSKRRGRYSVHAGQSRFFGFYRDYLLDELVPAGIESDYVFVNLKPPVGRLVSHSNIFQQVKAIGLRAGVGSVNPHMLRHTHATALAKAGWTSAEIAARLGQRSAASADVYVHLANDDIEKRLAETAHLVWPGAVQEAAR